MSYQIIFGIFFFPFFLELSVKRVLNLMVCVCRALCVVWTTPLVATLGMSLTIPLAMVADMVIHGRHYSAIYILGSAQVICCIYSLAFHRMLLAFLHSLVMFFWV